MYKNTTKGIGLEDECIKIFDPIKKELINICDNYPNTARYLGIPQKAVRDAIRNKTRRYSPFLKKEVAIRLANKNKQK